MTNFKARPTIYKGIQMRSRLEAGFAMWLDEWEADWQYEPSCFASGEGQYLPDFQVHGLWQGASVPAYIEVKPERPSNAVIERCARIIGAATGQKCVLIVAAADEPSNPTAIFCWPATSEGQPEGHPIRAAWTFLAAVGDGRLRLAAVPLVGPHASPWPDNWWMGAGA